MIENQKIRPAQVIGPLGEPLTIDSLPNPSTTRWVVRRKAEVVSAVNGGLLSVDEACERYGLSLEEFAGWQRAVDRSGMPGLRVTRSQPINAEDQHRADDRGEEPRPFTLPVPSQLLAEEAGEHGTADAEEDGKQAAARIAARHDGLGDRAGDQADKDPPEPSVIG